jgi:hypothetical protein
MTIALVLIAAALFANAIALALRRIVGVGVLDLRWMGKDIEAYGRRVVIPNRGQYLVVITETTYYPGYTQEVAKMLRRAGWDVVVV